MFLKEFGCDLNLDHFRMCNQRICEFTMNLPVIHDIIWFRFNHQRIDMDILYEKDDTVKYLFKIFYMNYGNSGEPLELGNIDGYKLVGVCESRGNRLYLFYKQA